MRYDLPRSLTFRGRDWAIRADFRAALEIFAILNDPELTASERMWLTLLYFYPQFSEMGPEDYPEAIEACFAFLSAGEKGDGPVLMSWEQDFPYIIAPVNRVVGREVRAEAFFHWWSFLGAYREIGECLFSQMVRIRSKQASGKKLDPAEAAWYRANRDIVDLKRRFSPEEQTLLRRWGGEPPSEEPKPSPSWEKVAARRADG